MADAWDKTASFEGTDARQQALRNCLGKLKEKDRRRMSSYYADGQTIRVMAREEKRSESSLHQIFHRLRVKLKECIEQQLSNEGGAA